jgi:hypothetical protein
VIHRRMARTVAGGRRVAKQGDLRDRLALGLGTSKATVLKDFNLPALDQVEAITVVTLSEDLIAADRDGDEVVAKPLHGIHRERRKDLPPS